ncbi:hypothetical protein [Pontibacter sp. BAB1700]|uniref:hypothetical protein n=1 Tax=Pontibacter sp. BAB1700 TaxID=1144253 RepID=UPI00026BE951|nr:hypothetical protein [Pontibacter sp. BAB1700]EJF09298.1 hypothetical protein O71_15770 [Pontibacter sp. BAB1700]
MENFNNYTGRARDARSKNKLLGLWRYAMVLVVGLLLITPYSFSQSITSFSQYANKNKEWIPGILQSSKSDYYEGSSTLQRLVFVGIPTAQNNQYELKFKVLATKGGINAYDFVTGYDQAFKDFYNMTDREIIADIATNNPFDPSDPNDMLLLVKSYAIPQPASEEIIDALYKSTHKVIASSPSAASYTNAGRSDVGAAVSYYDGGSYPTLTSNPRGVQLYGNAPISGAQLIFDGYSGVEPNTGDNYGLYTLRWTSQSTNLMVLMAGHLSIGSYEPYAPLNYGAGKGSSSISGGPYHFKLETLNGASLGNQDNQIQSGAIMPPPLCDLPPAGPVCVGEITEHTVTATSGASYKWTVSGNGELVNNATPPVVLSSPYTSSSNSIRVRATGGGSYTITVEISASGRTRTCSETVTVYANPDLDDYETDYCEDDFESMDLADFNESIALHQMMMLFGTVILIEQTW